MSVIKYFKINGLHGYKNISIDFLDNIRILISENGSGKTTILNALDCFLNRDFLGLRKIDFDHIVCGLNGVDEELLLHKKDINFYIGSDYSPEMQEILGYGVEESELAEFILNDYIPGDSDSVTNSSLGAYLYAESPWDWDRILELLTSVSSEFGEKMSENVDFISSKIKQAIGETEILYLPTYRRVETPLLSRDINHRRRRRFSKNLSLRDASLVSGRESRPTYGRQINYGLVDVEERLGKMTEEIQKRTNFGYRQISATIIEDLLDIDSNFESISENDLPDKESMQRFFSRIGSVGDRVALNSDLINKIYAYDENNRAQGNTVMLRYFMSKLSSVIDQTKALETAIENFVDKSNDYLGMSIDEKELEYDREKMKVYVRNKWTNAIVKLNDLSSGEKQVLSLIAYLYLYDSDKIILIDEPELSLSLDWQQKILVDVVSAPGCKQLLAITHSPFIYDNELDKYGASLKINRVPVSEGNNV